MPGHTEREERIQTVQITPTELRPVPPQRAGQEAVDVLTRSARGGRLMEMLSSDMSCVQEFWTSGFSVRRDSAFPQLEFSFTYGNATRPGQDEVLERGRTIRRTLGPDPPGTWHTASQDFRVSGSNEITRYELAYRIDYDRESGGFTMTLRGSGSVPDRVLDLSNAQDQELAMVVVVADAVSQQVRAFWARVNREEEEGGSSLVGNYRNTTNTHLIYSAFRRLTDLPALASVWR